MNKLRGEIILVDNEDYEEELLLEVLQRLNYEAKVRYFDDAGKAFKYLTQTKTQIFIIISDINMDPITGIEFKAEIDADPVLKQKSIPFVFVTTSTSQRTIEEAYKYRIQGFFEKQNTPKAFADSLLNIIQYWITSLHPNK